MAAARWDVPRHAPPRAPAHGLARAARAARAAPVAGEGAAHDLPGRLRMAELGCLEVSKSSTWDPLGGSFILVKPCKIIIKTMIHPRFHRL